MRAIGALFGALALGACAATLPTGPTVMALPAQGKSFVDFQQDDLDCRQYAAQQTGGVSPSEAASESLAGNPAICTLLGAAAGAAIGAATGGAAAGGVRCAWQRPSPAAGLPCTGSGRLLLVPALPL